MAQSDPLSPEDAYSPRVWLTGCSVVATLWAIMLCWMAYLLATEPDCVRYEHVTAQDVCVEWKRP